MKAHEERDLQLCQGCPKPKPKTWTKLCSPPAPNC